ncbi:ankyrin repeat protein [Megavirus baoshan]|uniref:Ankyrin repeat protein n=1 Tax=Megavirus baoshan TaxID=2496520 RepID=A0A3S8UWT4_9VIRU|nr:ankyrin repeat protein [Megavirus baoshan]AZL89242.1 ankyrin repeat protein [Megavirus baoshan]
MFIFGQELNENNIQQICEHIRENNISDDEIKNIIKNIGSNFTYSNIKIRNFGENIRNCLQISISDEDFENIIDPYKFNRLCCDGDLIEINEYISNRDISDKDIYSALNAVLNNDNPNLSIISLLLSHPNWIKTQYNSETIINIIVETNNKDVMIYMLDNVPNFVITKKMIRCCIDVYQNYEMLLLLIQYLKNPVDFIEKNELMVECAFNNNPIYLDLFLDLGVTINDDLFLQIAITRNNKYYVQKYLEYGHEPKNKKYIIEQALYYFYEDILNLLLDYQIECNISEITKFIKTIKYQNKQNKIISIFNEHGMYIDLD